jgi:hypothetical protein
MTTLHEYGKSKLADFKELFAEKRRFDKKLR